MATRDCNQPTLISPWRRRFQWLTSLLILLLPWAHIDGKSLLRIDLETLSLYLFGQLLRIEELYLLLFFSLCLILLFLLGTLVLGRVWCGWACPQTTLNDLAEWLARRCGLHVADQRLVGSRGRKLVVHTLYALLALTVGANLVWYFVAPQRFFAALQHAELDPWVWIVLLVTALIVYLDLAVVRRLMCSDFCPYGRFQTALVDPGTLTLLIPAEETVRCIECGACVRSCPMEIDIRRGYQIECINCGRCLDACRKVMFKRQQDGLIHYRFGTDGKGPRALLHPRTLLLAGTLLILALVLTSAILLRAEASLKIAVSHTAASRALASGEQVTFFNAWVNNRSERTMVFELHALADATGQPLKLKGQTRNLELAGGGNRRLEFALVSPPLTQAQTVTFHLLDQHGTAHATVTATLLPLTAGIKP